MCRIEISKTDLEISDLVGSESRSPDPDVDGGLYMGPKEGVMTSQATESASVLTVPAMMAGALGLALNGSEFGTPDPIEGGNGGRSLGVIVGVKVPAAATTRKDVDLSTPTSGSRRGTRFGSDLLYGSDSSGKQKSEPSSGGFGSPVERNACIGSPMPAAGDLSHSEQNGRCDVDMEAILGFATQMSSSSLTVFLRFDESFPSRRRWYRIKQLRPWVVDLGSSVRVIDLLCY